MASSATRLESAGRSDTGRVRRRNEDAMLHRPEAGLLGVADGMGGAPAGDVASQLAVEVVAEFLEEGAAPSRERMVGAFQRVHERLLKDQRDHPERQGMGTTLTVVALQVDTGRFVLGHVGDSRGYRYGGDALERISRDHTWVQEEVDRGRLSPEAARRHPAGHILTQVLGVGEEIRPDVREGVLGPGEILLLCTDGLLAALDEDEIQGVVEGVAPSAAGLQEGVDELVERAHQRGSPDNLAVILACRPKGE